MKNKKSKINLIAIILIIIATSIFSGCIGQQENRIKISGAFALYPMMNIWAEEYQKSNPNVKIEVSAGGAGKGMADAIAGIVNIGMISRQIYPEEIAQGIFWVSVVKDAVVATINTDNPVIYEILAEGLTKQQFIDVFITRDITTWGNLIGDTSITDVIKVYTRSDSCGAAATWAEYLGDYTQDDLTNSADSAINGDPNLAAAVQSDKFGIGFNNINFVYDPKLKTPFLGIFPIPIDINENGVIDEGENFYDKRDEIVTAIADNIYPSPPARALHLVTKDNFTGTSKDFVYWILTEGQKYVSEGGYIALSNATITNQLEYLEIGQRPEIG